MQLRILIIGGSVRYRQPARYDNRMTPFFPTRLFVFSAVTALLIGGAGCRPPRPEGVGPLALPPDGSAAIVSRAIKETTDTVHWKWSLIGERNWRKADAQGPILSLADVYPLNSVSERGGCNIWEADVTVEKVGSAAHWQARLHGSVGTTVTSEGTADLKGASLRDAVRITQDKDVSPNLPADLTLARIGETEVRLRVAK